jgi:hypothetical protein
MLKKRVMFRLAEACKQADIIITHSNGANFTTDALNMLGPDQNNKKIVIHISPALDRDTPIPLAVKAQLVLYTQHDFWVKLSTFLPFHPWGRMGARGYSGNDNRNTNHEDPTIKTHSGWFKLENVGGTWNHCEEFIEANTK